MNYIQLGTPSYLKTTLAGRETKKIMMIWWAEQGKERKKEESPVIWELCVCNISKTGYYYCARVHFLKTIDKKYEVECECE